MASFPGPWAYGATGLGEGLAQGLMLGMQNRRQKEELEQQKRARAMQLLLGGYKLAEQDPDAAKDLFAKMGVNVTLPTAQEKMQKQVTGQIQGFQMAKDAIKKQYPNMTEEQVNMFAAGTVGVPWRQSPVPWVNAETGEVYAGHPYKERVQYPPAYIGDPYHRGTWVEGDQGPFYATPGNPPAPGYSKFKPSGPGKEPQPKVMRLTDGERKAVAAATEVLRNPEGKTPEQIADAKSTIEGLQGKVTEGKPTKTFAGSYLKPWTWGEEKDVPTYNVTQPPAERTVRPQGGGGVPDEVMKARGFVRGPDGKWMKAKQKQEEPEE